MINNQQRRLGYRYLIYNFNTDTFFASENGENYQKLDIGGVGIDIDRNNTSVGQDTLTHLTTGFRNTVLGKDSLRNTTSGNSNTAVGDSCLRYNSTGSANTVIGRKALHNNTEGSNNVAVGNSALFSNTEGDNNTSIGKDSSENNTTGAKNTVLGSQALRSNTAGSDNVAIGFQALKDVTTGSGNFGAAFKNTNNSYTPVFNPTTEDNRVVMGHTSVTNAYVQVAWTVTSDARDKMNFAPVSYGLDFINQLQPTAYQFKVDRNTEVTNGPVRYGFKAQDILELEGDNPVIIDNEDPDNLKYKGEHLVPVLVNAVKELTVMVNDLKAEIQTLKNT
ncbi:MAG: hypothetical protein CBC48_17440 [bacterium TMED88]|nr:MAG: hypothetical protein CBC48_17440 [bacterium TMED88]